MNAQQRDALRDKVEGTTAAFVDASVATLEKEMKYHTGELALTVAVQQAEIQTLQSRLAALEANSIKSVDERYSLTKSKMINMMKELGYYD
jgi:hypothetical protein